MYPHEKVMQALDEVVDTIKTWFTVLCILFVTLVVPSIIESL